MENVSFIVKRNPLTIMMLASKKTVDKNDISMK